MAQMIVRLPAVIKQSGLARSTIYKAIDSGVWTRPVRLGPRAVGWPSHECDAILAARIAGKTDDEIRALVTKLEAARRNADIAAA